MSTVILALVLSLWPLEVYQCAQVCKRDGCWKAECEDVCQLEPGCFLDCMEALDDCDRCIRACEE